MARLGKSPRTEDTPPAPLWDRVTERLKERFPQLIQDDLAFRKGHETEMLIRIEQRLQKSPLEMAVVLDDIMRGVPTVLPCTHLGMQAWQDMKSRDAGRSVDVAPRGTARS